MDINLIFRKIVYLTLRITLFTYSKKAYRTHYWKTVFCLAFSIMDYFDTRENHWTSGALHKTPRRAAFKSRSSTQSEEIRRVLPRGRAPSFLFINPAVFSVHLPPSYLHLWKYESNHNVDGYSGIGSCTKEWWKASGTRRVQERCARRNCGEQFGMGPSYDLVVYLCESSKSSVEGDLRRTLRDIERKVIERNRKMCRQIVQLILTKIMASITKNLR